MLKSAPMLTALFLSVMLLPPCEDWTILVNYTDLYGELASYQEIVCGEEAAEVRTDEIEAHGFEPVEGLRIPHAALRQIDYYPFRGVASDR